MEPIGKFLKISFIYSMPLVAEIAGSVETGRNIKKRQTQNGKELLSTSLIFEIAPKEERLVSLI
jgi:hypothetical protein